MQSSLIAQRSSLKTRLPDISAALETVNHLIEKRTDAETDATQYTYQLSENIWSTACVPPTNVVCLWLGANCMLEYTLDEAVALLSTNESNARATLKSLDEDMAFIRDQITTTEVNIARTHNFGVKLRQKQKEEGGEAAALPSSGSAAPSAPQKVPAAPAGPPPGGESSYGGTKFTWKQEAEEVEVSVAVPAGAHKAHVKVTILADSLRVEHAGDVLLEGSLSLKCSPGGSTWTMNNCRIEISLEKLEPQTWPSLFEAP